MTKYSAIKISQLKTDDNYKNITEINDIKSLIKLGTSIRLNNKINLIVLWKIMPYLQQLDRMVGMENVKMSLVYQILYFLQGLQSKNDYLHIMIYGPPGSGKTTLSNIIAKIYIRLNIIDKDKVIFAKRDDFIAGYLGQTAQKTTNFLNNCLGHVLFVDEIYSLGVDTDDKDSFSKEALNTLNYFLSENRTNFCCIGAGYKDEIEKNFFAINKGLKRRFQWVLEIDESTCEHKVLILRNMANKDSWELNATSEFLKKIISDNPSIFEFSGGSIETFITKCKMLYASRVFGFDKEETKVINQTDILKTIENFYPKKSVFTSMMYV